MPRSLRSLAAALGLIVLGGALSGCIIADEGWHHHGWCWWHDCR